MQSKRKRTEGRGGEQQEQQCNGSHIGASLRDEHVHKRQTRVTQLLMQQLYPTQLTQLGGGGGEGKPPEPPQQIGPTRATNA